MSDPKCKTCKFFTLAPLCNSVGACDDPSKIIRDSNGNHVHEEITTWSNYSCDNHKSTNRTN